MPEKISCPSSMDSLAISGSSVVPIKLISAPAMNESSLPRITTARTRASWHARKASLVASASRRITDSVSTLTERSGSSNMIQPIECSSISNVGLGRVVMCKADNPMSRTRTPEVFGGGCQSGKDTVRRPKGKPPGRSVRPGGSYSLKFAGPKSDWQARA